jgi:GTP pyrophosphokinase
MSKNVNNPIIESYNVDEEFLYGKAFNFIKGYATALKLSNTLKALPLARKIHNGQYRKGEVTINGQTYKLPYFVHVLNVCSTLMSLPLPLSVEELDILFSSAILHDAIEDAPEGFFRAEGYELVTNYGFPMEVYQIVKLVSKRSGASEEELSQYFNEIKKNKLALLIKMADRSHNVEDLHNMKPEKLHKYVYETRQWIYPLSTYAKANYPELSNGVTILKSKIESLVEETEALISIYETMIANKDEEISNLKSEINKLKKELSKLKKD